MNLVLNEIIKRYDQENVINSASFSFKKGLVYGILGRNGAGKTTLFNCISGNLDMDGGDISLEEGGETRPLKYDDIGMVSASPSLPEFLTGYEFIKCFIDLHREKIVEGKEIDVYFDMIRFNDVDRHRLIKEYSFGMKNKIQLLCCLILKPKVILLDEPLTSFDIIVSHDIKELLIAMKSEHIILMSTHILQLAEDVCDEIVILSKGILTDSDYTNIKGEHFEDYVVSALQEV